MTTPEVNVPATPPAKPDLGIVTYTKHALTGGLFDYKGRARRAEYWWSMLGIYILVFVSTLSIDFIVGGLISDAAVAERNAETISSFISLLTVFPNVSLGVRRLHDTGRSGWWILIAWIPIVNFYYLFLMLSDSEPAPNKWGPSPKYG